MITMTIKNIMPIFINQMKKTIFTIKKTNKIEMITNQKKMKSISKNTNLMMKNPGMRIIKILKKSRRINSMTMNLGMKTKMNRS
jgi:hypothetical protein